jgi:hypothetical protein
MAEILQPPDDPAEVVVEYHRLLDEALLVRQQAVDALVLGRQDADEVSRRADRVLAESVAAENLYRLKMDEVLKLKPVVDAIEAALERVRRLMSN